MPSRIDGLRAIPSEFQGSDTPSYGAAKPCAERLNFDVLRHIFGYLDEARDILSACQVSHLWHDAAISRPLVPCWYQASNRAVQGFVRNKKQSTDLFCNDKSAVPQRFTDLLSQQTSLRLDGADQGLNQHRMQQAFVGMPALRALQLLRKPSAQNRGAAVIVWPETTQLHERVRRQSVPPEHWLGDLPAQLTHLDLSKFSLCCTEENAGRPVLENKLISGLMQSLAEHTRLTHLTLGAFDVDRLVLPEHLTHLTLTRSLRAQQTQSSLALRLLRAIPTSLTHLHAGNAVSLAQLPKDDVWPAGLALAHLSIRAEEDDILRLQRVLQPPLRSLNLTCVHSATFDQNAEAITFPATLRELRLNLCRASSVLQAHLFSQLPEGLVLLSIEVPDASGFDALRLTMKSLPHLTRVRIRLPDSSDMASLVDLLWALPQGCTEVHLSGISSQHRSRLRRELTKRPQLDLRVT